MIDRRALKRSSSLAGGALAAVLALSPALAHAQAAPAPQEGEQTQPQDATEVEEVIVTGSRIPANEFTSSSPVQQLTTERAEQRGLGDTAQFLQSSTIAAGSPQVNATISSAFVTDGGPGSSTISLRGLGANRTLVLLNGRRAGPAGTRGGVSAFDLNVIPQASISRIDILKDGASSIYGSDAVAGVVNIVTNKTPDGAEFNVFATAPFEGGGEQYDVSGAWGKTFDRGYLSVSADYYRQEALRAGDRDYLICRNNYVFDRDTGARADRIDPRTGKPACTDLTWGQIYVYGPDFSSRAGRFQYDYDGNLGNFIPPRPTNPAVSAMYPTAPNGFYIVNYDPASRAVVNALSPLAYNESIVPEVERYTAFVEGGYDLTSNIELYGEFLLNRRESRTDSYRQFWNYTYTADFLDFYYGPGAGGDPVTGFNGLNFLSATPATAYSASQKVDYMRAVVGLRGDFDLRGKSWKWDIFAQASRSDGDYTSDVILQDAVDSTSFKTSSCVGTNLPVSGRPCIDVDFTAPNFLAGIFTDAEKAFLFDVDTGNTVYEQTYLEGYVGGELFDLPAGPLGLALGFHVRKDKIDDVPGEITRSGNSWGLTSAGITRGTEDTREVFGELSVPLVKDVPFFSDLELSLSGRYTDTKTSGAASTYKVGLNWEIMDGLRLRATHGTSFRAPALFELYLADQSGFVNQRSIDPCLNLDQRLADGSITQQLYNNCTSAAGPGGGVPGDFPGATVSATVITGGGLGVLEPETSTADVFGIVLTPPDSGISVAIDYFEIEIENEVAAPGAATILSQCYLSDNFPTDPICNQFDRDPNNGTITEVRASFLNIAQQSNRGMDFTVRYQHETPWGDLTLDSQTTWTFENATSQFAGFPDEVVGQIGYPALVGNINATFSRGPWTAFWGYDWIGKQDSLPEFIADTGSPYVTLDGRTVAIKGHAEFTGFHSVSLAYEWDGWKVTGGVANLFDELPPTATSSVASTSGNSILASQYTEGYYGRRGFLRFSKSF